jgi:CRP/FNR family transcriptional regulator, cyclic AMP receptor protein
VANLDHPRETRDLGGLDLFAGLERSCVDGLMGSLEQLVLDEGASWSLVDADVACAVLLSGRLALDVETSAPGMRTICLVEQGDVLVRPTAEWASASPVRCRAIETSRVMLVDAPTRDLWMEVPRLAINMVRVLSMQMADRELAAAIALEPRVERRLLLKIRQLAERFGRVTPDGVRLDLRLTHQQLGEMVGAVRESVTIALRSLADQGVLEVRYRTIILKSTDLSGLGD